MRAREPQSFWREKVVAVVTLLLVLAGMSKGGGASNQMLKGFYKKIFYKNKRANFSGEK